MIVELVERDELLPESVTAEITKQIKKAFADKYVINDRKWFNPTIENSEIVKVRPMVVNSADHISRGFQSNLELIGWTQEKKIDDQKFDAYRVLRYSGQIVQFDEVEFLEAISKLDVTVSTYPETVSRIYKCFYKRGFPYAKDILGGKIKSIGKPHDGNKELRIGLEFETGNIASSFRAISKLNFLFDQNRIDLGVFITSDSKDTSTRIWPQTNRNGSIEELKKRKFMTQIKFPYLIYGFRPEGYSENSPYLSKNGTYQIEIGGKSVVVDRIRYTYDAKGQILTLA